MIAATGSLEWFYSWMDELMCEYACASIDSEELDKEVILLCKEVAKYYGSSKKDAC